MTGDGGYQKFVESVAGSKVMVDYWERRGGHAALCALIREVHQAARAVGAPAATMDLDESRVSALAHTLLGTTP